MHRNNLGFSRPKIQSDDAPLATRLKKALEASPPPRYHNTVHHASIDVSYVAGLARLQLSEAETATFQKQLQEILGYVDQLREVDVSSVPDHPIDPNLPTNALRLDEIRPSLPHTEALQNAPKQANQLLSVPKIVE